MARRTLGFFQQEICSSAWWESSSCKWLLPQPRTLRDVQPAVHTLRDPQRGRLPRCLCWAGRLRLLHLPEALLAPPPRFLSPWHEVLKAWQMGQGVSGPTRNGICIASRSQGSGDPTGLPNKKKCKFWFLEYFGHPDHGYSWGPWVRTGFFLWVGLGFAHTGLYGNLCSPTGGG